MKALSERFGTGFLVAIKLLICAALVLPGTRAAEKEETEVLEAVEEAVILPEPIRDPLEPVNRVLWEVNKGLMTGVIQPTSKGYRVVVPKTLRQGIRNIGQNIGYPRRVVNNLLQEKWTGARDETYRFLCNSIFGIGGLFDVSTRWKIPGSEADFGQTLGTWGWRPHFYLMLPIAGPSNERDAVGSIVDSLVNPLTYFPPYSYITYGITYNNLSETVDEYVRVSKTDFDPYYVLRYAWTIKRESRGVDLTYEGDQDRASLETLQSVFFTFQDPKFPEYGLTRRVTIPATGRKLPFSYWMQPERAPLVYIVPGLGSHRLSAGTLALAEILYRDGFSVATVSSTFNYEFIQQALSSAMPGYAPVDAADLRGAISLFDEYLRSKHPEKISSRALMGYSMGGFHTLYLAGTEAAYTNENVRFDRYVAIDAPVDLNHAIDRLDGNFRAAYDWDASERTARIEKTFLKVAALTRQLGTLTRESEIPFDATESKFLIGLAFRLSLRDIIFLSQSRTNQGVLKQPVEKWRREAVYREILQLTFAEYLEKIVTPYYRGKGVDLQEQEVLSAAVDLRTHTAGLKGNEKVRVIENENDMLLGREGLEWIRETFDPARVNVFSSGGHLGNLSVPEVQAAILKTVSDLKE